jgi:HNH endonuclease
MRKIDLTGQVFGELTAVRRIGCEWVCQCSCGKETTVRTGLLRNGNTKACGHLWEKHHLTGRRFGRWTVTGPAPRGHDKMWHCRCSCGSVGTIIQGSLLKGISKSCGCYNSELTAARNFKHGQSRTPAFKSFYESRRRAKTMITDTDVTEDAMQEKLLAQNYQCHWCDEFLDDTRHCDHVVPLSRDGTHMLDNLVWACAPCNTQKNALLLHEWLSKPGCRATRFRRNPSLAAAARLETHAHPISGHESGRPRSGN